MYLNVFICKCDTSFMTEYNLIINTISQNPPCYYRVELRVSKS